MPESVKEVVRSFLITFVIVIGPLLAANDTWTWPALWAIVLAAGRTAVSALLPGGSFGRKPRKAVAA